ncbi:MAG: helix-turn-helix domain-containing protein [Coprobacillaceae bacterium]
MYISYKPFFKTIKKKKLSQYDLIHNFGLSKGTLDSLRNNKNMRLSTIVDLCEMLDCKMQDIVTIEKQ